MIIPQCMSKLFIYLNVIRLAVIKMQVNYQAIHFYDFKDDSLIHVELSNNDIIVIKRFPSFNDRHIQIHSINIK